MGHGRQSTKYYLSRNCIGFDYLAAMSISLRVLRYVVTSAECGNVSEAARRLHVSQPSVSGAIAELEAGLGMPIFVRHHARGVSLTAAGTRLVNEARLLLKHADDFERGAIALGGALQGEIAVGCFMTLAPRFMPALLAAFSRRHPGITVKLEEGDQKEILEALTSGRTELALSYAFAVPDQVATESLTDLPPYAIVASTHPLARREIVSLAELVDDPLVLLDLPHSREYFFGLFRSCGLEPRIGYRSRSYELVRGLVANGHGYAIHNAILHTTTTYDGGTLAVLRLKEKLAPVSVVSLRLRRPASRQAVAAFADFVREAFSPAGLFGAVQ